MLGWLVAGATALGALGFAMRTKIVDTLNPNRPLEKQVRTGDSVIVQQSGVREGIPSETLRAELALVKAANIAKSTLRVDEVRIDSTDGTAGGVIIGTPTSPTTVVRFRLSDVMVIERPDSKAPDGFLVIT